METLLAILAHELKLALPVFWVCSGLWNGKAEQLLSLLDDQQISLKSIDEGLARASALQKQCQRQGIDILHPRSSSYPKCFFHLADAPLFLTYYGDIELLAKPSIAVVGARHPLLWIEEWMEQEFLPYLQRTSLQVVSGGAIGTDHLAHRLALRADCSSVAVLPSGIMQLYPKQVSRFRKYADDGRFGFLSEYPPDQSMRKHHFYYRNRLIASMASVLFVVQAQRKSGTMITAEHAANQSKDIFTIVNSPIEPATHGNLQLLFDGAGVVRWGSDLPGG